MRLVASYLHYSKGFTRKPVVPRSPPGEASAGASAAALVAELSCEQSMTTFDPPLRHTRRLISDLGVHSAKRWRFKLYGIAGEGPAVSQVLVERGKSIAAESLPSPAVTSARYGVGFVIVHEAHAFNTVVVDWWEQVNELRHHVFRAAPGRAEAFDEITSSGEAVCVWELRIQAFEREAWLRCVLENAEDPDLDAYLVQRLTELC